MLARSALVLVKRPLAFHFGRDWKSTCLEDKNNTKERVSSCRILKDSLSYKGWLETTSKISTLLTPKRREEHEKVFMDPCPAGHCQFIAGGLQAKG
jgi:hypothetical protein